MAPCGGGVYYCFQVFICSIIRCDHSHRPTDTSPSVVTVVISRYNGRTWLVPEYYELNKYIQRMPFHVFLTFSHM